MYVGDLHRNVTKCQFYNLFNQIGKVSSVKICKNMLTRESLSYGYVNFTDPLIELNFSPLNGKPIRIMHSNRDPSVRNNDEANLFVKVTLLFILEPFLYDQGTLKLSC
uniref:Polyadenylate-binding protein 2 n=1 Tax=Cajanus cajan TaxID=3821 RepID=A0A151UGD9_CAJCA